MSTLNFVQIGDWIRRNQADIAIVIGFILVAIIAFGAGRLSSPEIIRNPIAIEEPNASSSVDILNNVSQPVSATAGESAVVSLANQTSAKGLFVASRGGTKYHWPWCSYGQKIKLENQIWFNSEKEAQAVGYSPCACIASKAPAGYQKP